MKKLISHFYVGKNNPNNSDEMFGVSQEIRWKLSSYFSGPAEDGEYLTSDGKGNVEPLLYSVKGSSMFELVQSNNFSVYWDETDEKLTSDELIDLLSAHTFNVWYSIAESYVADGYGEDGIYILKNKPKYFLEEKLQGPIDSELDECEEEFYKYSRISGYVKITESEVLADENP